MIFGSLKMGLIAVVPNIFPIMTVFGLMGWADMKLNISTIMTAPIIIGIAVDDTIHFLTRYRMELPALKWNYRLANDKTILTTGLAMITTTGILVMGFLILIFSNFTPTADFGLLAALTIFIALVCDLTFLPALLGLVKPRIDQDD